MTLCALLMLAAAAITLFRFPRIYRERIATPYARLTLRMWGIALLVLQDSPLPESQTIFISNHTSTLDIFILLAMGLPNCRFFLSGYLRKLIPLGIISYLMGTFWTVDQIYPQQRSRIFQRAERILRRTGESVFLSPEGERVTTGKVGPFNKGAFHLATALHVPIVPLFIAIPKSINPGMALTTMPGTVHVYVKPAIPTNSWQLEDIDRHKEEIRQMYESWNRTHSLP
jgi:1-acyl-sn-glycerol-3-phosphate acyltransferase